MKLSVIVIIIIVATTFQNNIIVSVGSTLTPFDKYAHIQNFNFSLVFLCFSLSLTFIITVIDFPYFLFLIGKSILSSTFLLFLFPNLLLGNLLSWRFNVQSFQSYVYEVSSCY